MVVACALVQHTVGPGLASPIGVLGDRDDLDLDRGVLLERVDRQLDTLVSRRLDADERLSVADILSKALAEIPENDRAEERGFELGFHRRWDGSDFLEHLQNDIAGRHALGLQTIAGVLGNTFGLEYAHNDSCRHLSLLVIHSLTLPERSNGDKARRAAFVDGGERSNR